MKLARADGQCKCGRECVCGLAKLILQESSDGRALLAVRTNGFRSLEAFSVKVAEQTSESRYSSEAELEISDLKKLDSGYRLVAVNGQRTDISKMAEEMCFGSSATVKLQFESAWLASGASVAVENLRLGYGNIPRDVLKSISFKLERGCKLAVAGTTGCGKSTLMLAILRMLEPRGGRILIEGVDTQTLGLETLRTAVGFVPQDPVIFSGTIRTNLDPFQEFGDESIWEALEACTVAQHIRDREGGLDAEVSAEGENLSFGQRQLLCIARAVLRQPQLLLLDEATSSIDPASQELVQSTIRKCFPEATIIAIAHRLETILDFDRVLVLDKGIVVEDGGIHELKDVQGGHFNKMLSASGSARVLAVKAA